MNLSLYRLPPKTMVTLMKMIDLGQISLMSLPKRRELSEIYRFIKDYLDYKSK